MDIFWTKQLTSRESNRLINWSVMSVTVSHSRHRRRLWVTLCGGLWTPAPALIGAQTPAVSGVTPTTLTWASGTRLWKRLSSNLLQLRKAARRRTTKATPTSGIIKKCQRRKENRLSHGLLMKSMTYHLKEMSNTQILMTYFCLPPALLCACKVTLWVGGSVRKSKRRRSC